jgi:cofilin
MLYASSRDALRRSLNGVGAEIQGTDYTEVSHEVILEKVRKGN